MLQRSLLRWIEARVELLPKGMDYLAGLETKASMTKLC